MSDLIFQVHQEDDGGYWAKAEGVPLVTQGDTWKDLCANVKEVVDVYYDGLGLTKPAKVQLHLVHTQELLVA